MVKGSFLLRKMLRDMRRSWSAYLISGCIVTLGVLGYSVLSLACDSMNYARQQFYRESSFADGFGDVQGAPQGLARQLERLEGVSRAEGRMVTTGRVVSIPEAEAELQLYSYTPEGLCHPVLQTGRSAQRGEVLLSSEFMAAHGLSQGDIITMDVQGQRIHLRISGTALAPETVYMVKDLADMLPDFGRYDAAYIPYDTLTNLTGQQGMANSFVITLEEGISFEAVKPAMEQLLRPYGLASCYPRKDQLSYAILQAEIEQLERMGSSVPLLFLGIAAIIMMITLSRLVEQQRTQVGTLMALGLTPRRLMWHYSGFGVWVGLIGGLLGGITGIYAADAMGSFYRDYFRIPSYGLYFSPWYLIGGTALSVVVCGGIAVLAARKVLQLSPAVALRPAPPAKASKTLLERLPGLSSLLTMPGRMAVRSLFRNKKKTILSVVGVACAYLISAVLLSMYTLMDAFIFDYLEGTQKQDFTVTFAQPVARADALRAVQVEGVELAEPVTELLITLLGREESLDCTLMALPMGSQLYLLFDQNDVPVPVTEEGIIISRHMARVLGVEVGEKIDVEINYPTKQVRTVVVSGLAEQYMGGSAYCSTQQMTRLSEAGDGVTSLYLRASPQAELLLRSNLEDSNRIAGIQSRAQRVEAYRAMVGNFSAMLLSMALMGVAIGFAVVYTGSLISFEELKREISILLGLGLSTGQAVEIIGVGQWLIAFVGMLLGWPMTVAVSRTMSATMSTNLYTIPDFVDGGSLLLAVGLTMVSVWLGMLVLHRRIRRMNPMDLMHERE